MEEVFNIGETKKNKKNDAVIDYMMFSVLWYMIEEMNSEAKYEAQNKGTEESFYVVLNLNIDEEKDTGTVIIKDTKDNSISKWNWDSDCTIWIRE